MELFPGDSHFMASRTLRLLSEALSGIELLATDARENFAHIHE